jgi:glucosamine--fructose-6-phosphate aminotransferase (isomerizing)
MTAVDSTTPQQPGWRMAQDMAEQPAVLRHLLAEGAPAIAEVAAAIAAKRPRFVLFVARGTSDHAALYAKYLAEIRLGLVAGLASPSTVTVYDSRPDFSDVLVVGVSQSGGSPDLVRFLEAAGSRGATTVAVTNNAASALNEAAQFSVDVAAGTELAVAATKTYTAELLALLLLFEGIRHGDGRVDVDAINGLAALPDLAEELLADRAAELASARYRFANRLVVTGRGYAYPTAREAALKLMETSYLGAQAFSGADLLHGPLAMADAGLPVLGIVTEGPGGHAMAEVLERVAERGADLLVVGPKEVEVHAAQRIVTPAVDETIAPILDILPLQALARHLAVARGDDPDAPRGLRKVTETL